MVASSRVPRCGKLANQGRGFDIKQANLQTSTGATSSLPLLRACLLESIAERCGVELL